MPRCKRAEASRKKSVGKVQISTFHPWWPAAVGRVRANLIGAHRRRLADGRFLNHLGVRFLGRNAQ